MTLEMSGKMDKYLLDTNTIIYALNSGFRLPKHIYLISIINEIELLSYHKLTNDEEYILKKVLSNFANIQLTHKIKSKTIEIRKKYNLKLPDSIVVATAIVEKPHL
jgi:predicted nucleic acid-binding protein